MNWKIKAMIQNLISFLPASLSYKTYYLVQRKIGRLKEFDVLPIIKGGIKIFELIKEAGAEPNDKVFFEVGTGRSPIIPITYWLMGAKQTITVDLNPYVEHEIVKYSVNYIINNIIELRPIFGGLLLENRLSKLKNINDNNKYSINELFKLCNIKYISPGDATNINLDSNSIDFHTSFTVFEHIPRDVIQKILSEGNRITKSSGLFINAIDYFDHFMHFDKNISSVNFLQYSDSTWKRYADNRFMYMNRLRHDDFIKLLEESKHKIIFEETNTDYQALQQLENGLFKLNSRFSSKPNETNCISSSWLVSKTTR